MELVVDTNIVVAAVIRAGGTRSIILRPDLELSSPQRLLEEMEKHRLEMAEKSGLDAEGIGQAIQLVLSNVRIARRAEYARLEERAHALAPDKKDAPFFALALALGCPIWTNDKRLKNQSEINVYSTSDLAKTLPPEAA